MKDGIGRQTETEVREMEVQRMQEAAASYGKSMQNTGTSVGGMTGGAGIRQNTVEPNASVKTDGERAADVREESEKVLGAGSASQIKKAVEEINKKAHNSEAIFGVHDATNRVTIKIVDKDTKEVLKEYPPEKTLDMIAKVWEIAGLLVDEKL